MIKIVCLTAIWTGLMIFLFIKWPLLAVGLIAWTQALEFYSKRYGAN